ncbi:PREDICTED: magnesium transporter MRS2-F-like [Nelumbo nucifera]|uniref:Magnesium transporter n=2 Tax=Nelumbo nucifera TaxID=4432 RepID=A0A822Z529_NELNU|nr:PREDICTED: magnesium transporter MRS2-F-like [Nelumbo nucifera]DAD39663.1 TPA_asm: hypothetical protein HUJ06_013986 [Nelumbo nucifera]
MKSPKVSSDEEFNQTPFIPPQTRRKGIGTRTWLVISEFGQSHVEEVGKHVIMKRTGLPARDLRVLDPMLSYPSSILGRERAIVINLEHIKAIITATEVFVLNSKDPIVVPFIQDLQKRVSYFHGAPKHVTESSDTDLEVAATASSDTPLFHVHSVLIKPSSQNISEQLHDSLGISVPHSEMKDSSPKSTTDAPVGAGTKVLPFEFIALEACLESACRCLDSETSTLEQEAYPAFDELTSKISTLNLERVRQLKSRLVAISGRVQKVRDELEHLLDDDNDMAEMYLTKKLLPQPLEQTSPREEQDYDAYDLMDERAEDSRTENGSDSSSGFKPNIEELEMLLEAYFAQIDGVLNKLSTMREYVDDTEDYVNIMLDDKQNQLLQMGVILSTANMVLNIGIVIVGLFGMNIHIALFDGEPKQFWETTFGTIGGCVALYLIAFRWGKTKGLLA